MKKFIRDGGHDYCLIGVKILPGSAKILKLGLPKKLFFFSENFEEKKIIFDFFSSEF